MTRENYKKIFTVMALIAAVICLTLFARASDTNASNTREVTVTNWDELVAAVEDAEPNCENVIVVADDINAPYNTALEISADKIITLSLDMGKTLKFETENIKSLTYHEAYGIKNKGHLTITGAGTIDVRGGDGIVKTNGNVRIMGSYAYAIYNCGDGITEITENVTINTVGGDGYYLSSGACSGGGDAYTIANCNAGKVIVNGNVTLNANGGEGTGSFSAGRGVAILNKDGASVLLAENVMLNATGGKGSSGACGIGIWNFYEGIGTVTITGNVDVNTTGGIGTSNYFSGSDAYGIYNEGTGRILIINNKKIQVVGGKRTGKYDKEGHIGTAYGDAYSIKDYGNGTVIVTSGDFKNGFVDVNAGSLHGGKFAYDPVNFIAEDCTVSSYFIVNNGSSASADKNLVTIVENDIANVMVKLVASSDTSLSSPYYIADVFVAGLPVGASYDVTPGKSAKVAFKVGDTCEEGTYPVTLVASCDSGGHLATVEISLDVKTNDITVSNAASLDAALKSDIIKYITLGKNIYNFASFDNLGGVKSLDMKGYALGLKKPIEISHDLFVYNSDTADTGTIRNSGLGTLFGKIKSGVHLYLSYDQSAEGRKLQIADDNAEMFFNPTGGFSNSNVTVGSGVEFHGDNINGIDGILQNTQYLTLLRNGYVTVKDTTTAQNVTNFNDLQDVLAEGKINNIAILDDIYCCDLCSVSCDAPYIKTLDIKGKSLANFRAGIAVGATLRVTDTKNSSKAVISANADDYLFSVPTGAILSLDSGIYKSEYGNYISGSGTVKIANGVKIYGTEKPSNILDLFTDEQMLKQVTVGGDSNYWEVIAKSTASSMGVKDASDFAVAIENENVRTILITANIGDAGGFTVSSDTTGSKKINIGAEKSLGFNGGIAIKGGVSLDVTGSGEMKENAGEEYLFTVDKGAELILEAGKFYSSTYKYIQNNGGKVTICDGVRFYGTYDKLKNLINPYLTDEQALVEGTDGYCTVKNLTESFTVVNAEQLAKALSSSVTVNITFNCDISNFASFDHLGRAKSLDLNGNTLALTKPVSMDNNLTVYTSKTNGTLTGSIEELFGSIKSDSKLTLAMKAADNNTQLKIYGKAFADVFTDENTLISNGLKFTERNSVGGILTEDQYIANYKEDNIYYEVKACVNGSVTGIANKEELKDVLEQKKIKNVTMASCTITNIGNVTVSCDVNGIKTKTLALNAASLELINVAVANGVKLCITDNGKMSSNSDWLFMLDSDSDLSIDAGVFAAIDGNYISRGSNSVVKIANGVKFYGTEKPSNILDLISDEQMLKQVTVEGDADYWEVIAKSTAPSMSVNNASDFAVAVENDNVMIINVSDNINGAAGFAVSSDTTGSKKINVAENKTLGLDSGIVVKGGASLEIIGSGKMTRNSGGMFTIDEGAAIKVKAGKFYSASYEYIENNGGTVEISNGVQFYGTYEKLKEQINSFLGDEQVLVEGTDGYCTVKKLTESFVPADAEQLAKALSSSVTVNITLSCNMNNFASFDHLGRAKSLDLNGNMLTLTKPVSMDNNLTVYTTKVNGTLYGSNGVFGKIKTDTKLTLSMKASDDSTQLRIRGKAFDDGTSNSNVTIANGVKFTEKESVERFVTAEQYITTYTDSGNYYTLKGVTSPVIVSTREELVDALSQHKIGSVQIKENVNLTNIGNVTISCDTPSAKTLDLNGAELGKINVTIPSEIKLNIINNGQMSSNSGFVFTLASGAELSIDAGIFVSANDSYISGGSKNTIKIANGAKFYGTEKPANILDLITDEQMLKQVVVGEDTNYWEVIEKTIVSDISVSNASDFTVAIENNNITNIALSNDISGVGAFAVSYNGTNNKTINLDTRTLSLNGGITVQSGSSLDIKAKDNGKMSISNGDYLFTLIGDAKLKVESGTFYSADCRYISGGTQGNVAISSGVKFYGTYSELKDQITPFLTSDQFLDKCDDGYWMIRSISVTSATGENIVVVGDTLQLNVDIVPSSAAQKDITWTSSNTNIATVDANGLVTAKNIEASSESVTIKASTVSVNKAESTIEIIVKRPSVAAMTFAKTVYTFTPSVTELNLYNELSVEPENALKPKASEITWNSSNPNFAVTNGIVTIVTPTEEKQSTVITASWYEKETDEILSANCTVNSRPSTITLNLATKLQGRQSGGGTGTNVEPIEVWIYDASNNPLWNGSGTTDADGNVSFDIEADTFTEGQQVKLWIKGWRYLASLITKTVTIENGTQWNVTMDTALKAADSNADNKVNLTDFGILGNSFLKKTGTKGFCASADYNADGKVNLTDFGLLGNNFLKKGDAKPQSVATLCLTAAASNGRIAKAMSALSVKSVQAAEEALSQNISADEEEQKQIVLKAVENASGVSLQAEESAANSTSDSATSGTSGGCNSGFAVLALAALAFVRPRRKNNAKH